MSKNNLKKFLELDPKSQEFAEAWPELRQEILKLLEETASQKSRIEELELRKPAGRKPHDEKWTKSYADFVVQLEDGKTIMEIVSEGDISRRTAYRYKKYYEEQGKKEQSKTKK